METTSSLLSKAAEHGNFEDVQRLLAFSDPAEHHNFSLAMAAKNGHFECVKILIPRSDPKHKDSLALQRAARRGHKTCVGLLIPVSDPTAQNHAAFKAAAENDHLICLQQLLPYADDTAKNKALCAMAAYGFTDGVRFLLDTMGESAHIASALSAAALNKSSACFLEVFNRIDSTTNVDHALYCAAFKGHTQHVDLLYDMADISKVIDALQTDRPNDYERWAFLHARVQHENLNAAIDEIIGVHQVVAINATNTPRNMRKI